MRLFKLGAVRRKPNRKEAGFETFFDIRNYDPVAPPPGNHTDIAENFRPPSKIAAA
jgi:hypothetical protein